MPKSAIQNLTNMTIPIVSGVKTLALENQIKKER
jgi:hypothetical protein